MYKYNKLTERILFNLKKYIVARNFPAFAIYLLFLAISNHLHLYSTTKIWIKNLYFKNINLWIFYKNTWEAVYF